MQLCIEIRNAYNQIERLQQMGCVTISSVPRVIVITGRGIGFIVRLALFYARDNLHFIETLKQIIS